MPNEEDKKDKITGLEGLLNGVPLDPKQQWRMAARVNAMRDVLIEFIAAYSCEHGSKDFDEVKGDVKEQLKTLEDKYLETMNKVRAEEIEAKAKNARYRRFK